ncbi:MAG: 16S rRNA (adenine(1518)-N(6)/adenine(1519)-N(6))-dimethyltransferase RsmA [Candidatus Staskawiczbacteria bacterium]|jgi:16S rRNA (adenine1518-N6/adenine1519-N6)-dimethyltransferase
MNLTSPTIIKELLSKYKTRPSKGLGQNFLIDKNVLRKIIEASNIKPTDIILEVGPGIGILTQELAKHAKKVIAIEKDFTMCEVLKETLSDLKNIQIENCDILKFIENWKLKIENYKVVANIPYYLTSPLIRKFLENPPGGEQPQEIILMIQKEVAQRICASPPKMSLLAVSVQFYAEPKIISYVTKNCFWPAPKIDSAIINIKPKNNFNKEIDVDAFFKVVKAGFSQPRKQLVNNLTTLKYLDGVKLTKEEISNWLSKNNLKSNQRAESLTINDWENLTNSFLTLK